MDRQQFEKLFTSLYFALSTHSKNSGSTIHKGQSFYADGYALIELDRGYSLKLELADLVAYRDASALTKQRLLDGLIGQAQQALAAVDKAPEVESQKTSRQNES